MGIFCVAGFLEFLAKDAASGAMWEDAEGEGEGRDEVAEEEEDIDVLLIVRSAADNIFGFCGVGVWITWTLAQPVLLSHSPFLPVALSLCLSLSFSLPRMSGLSVSSELRGANYEDRS